jgi:ferric-dicitrate binding protein FerR (iron transport regulator)
LKKKNTPIKIATEDFSIEPGRSREQAWEELMSKVSEESISEATRVVPFYKNPRFVSWTAASVAILMGVFFFFNYFGEKHIYVPNAKTQTVIFPDGSEAVVNSHSALKYDEKDFYKNRTVTLNGEAFFNVKEGESFIVSTKLGAVHVLGTEFNVLRRDREFQVKCKSGEVKVVLGNSSREVRLISGQATRLVDHFLSDPYLIEPDHMAAWQDGEFYYKGDPLSLVISEMERQFDVQIRTKDIEDRVYTGYFSNDDLEEALELVFRPMDLEYDIIDSRLIIIR